MKLLVVDFDLTLCLTPVPANSGLDAWVRMVECAQADFVAVEGAREFVAEQLAFADAAVILTARPESLRVVTERWLAAHIHELARVPLSMRCPDDVSPARESKGARLAALRDPGDVVEMIDDDRAMHGYLYPGDVFRWAPHAWRLNASVDYVDNSICVSVGAAPGF